MDENRTGSGQDGRDARAGGSPVYVRSRSGYLEVTLARNFRDVDAIRSIPGRRWVPERLVWMLPDTQAVLDALKASFGGRLVFAEAPPRNFIPKRSPAAPPAAWPNRTTRNPQGDSGPASGIHAAQSPQPGREVTAGGTKPPQPGREFTAGGAKPPQPGAKSAQPGRDVTAGSAKPPQPGARSAPPGRDVTAGSAKPPQPGGERTAEGARQPGGERTDEGAEPPQPGRERAAESGKPPQPEGDRTAEGAPHPGGERAAVGAKSAQPGRERTAEGEVPDRAAAARYAPGVSASGLQNAPRSPPESQQAPVTSSRSQHTSVKPSEAPYTSRRREGGPEDQAGNRAALSQYASNATASSRQTCKIETERILKAMRQEIRVREYSRRTERAYISWVERFLRFHANSVQDPDQLTAAHATAFLDHLASAGRLAARSRNQAASALSFMFQEILGRDEMADVSRARGPARLPVVLSHREVLRVLRELTGKYFLIAVLLYSAGLRLEECLRMRVKDIDFELRQILVRDGKGKKDRYVPLARRAMDLLRAQSARVAERHENDRARGDGWAPLPGALHRKDPAAGYELGWQFVFAATATSTDPATGRACRVPLHPSAMQREVKRAVRRSKIPKRATCHTFRHSFATEALRGGCDIRTLQHVMGHKDVRTTMIYLHVVEQTGLYIRSPLDRPDDPEDYEVDPVGRPWSRVEEHWDLAARQWDPQRHSQHSARSRRAAADPSRPDDHSPGAEPSE